MRIDLGEIATRAVAAFEADQARKSLAAEPLRCALSLPSRAEAIRSAIMAAAVEEQPRLGFYPHSVPGYIHARSLAGFFVPASFAEQIRAQFRKLEASHAR